MTVEFSVYGLIMPLQEGNFERLNCPHQQLTDTVAEENFCTITKLTLVDVYCKHIYYKSV